MKGIRPYTFCKVVSEVSFFIGNPVSKVTLEFESEQIKIIDCSAH